MKPSFSPYRSLLLASLSWLLLPQLLFLGGWVTWPIALLLGAGLLLVSGKLARVPLSEQQSSWQLSRTQFLLLLGFAFCWAWLSGIGGYAWQRADYLKHALVWHDLVQRPWPIRYEDGSMLVYYLGYYLVPAAFAKLFGTGVLAPISLLWSTAGICLAALWWHYLSRLSLAWVLLGLSLFAGMDGLQILSSAAYEWSQIGSLSLIRLAPIEGHLPAVWGLGHRIPANFHQLAWAPQHAIAAWIATGMIWASLREKRGLQQAGWMWALLWLHSPFVAIGLAPLLLLGLFQQGIRAALSWENLLIGGSLLLLMGLFYAEHAPLSDKGFLWQTATHSDWGGLVLLFWVWEVGLLGGILLLRGRLQADRPWLLLVLLTVAALCLYRMGYYHDLLMRASIPAMMLLGIMSISQVVEFFSLPKRSKWGYALLVCLLIGSISPAQEQVKSLIYTLQAVPDFRQESIPPDWDMRKIDDSYAQQGIPHPFALAPQYLGSGQGIFAQFLIKSP